MMWTRRCPRAWVLSVSLLLLLPVVALADWAPADGHKMHFPQLPDETGWDVKAMNPVMLADDWQCSETGWVKDLHFWGSWKGGVQGTITRFNVVIFEDIPAAPPGIPFSRPGKVIWRNIITNFIAKPVTSTTSEGWYDPSTGLTISNDHTTYFQYNIFLPQSRWFHQDIGKIYWLGISADVQPGPVLAEWGWKSTKNHFNDDAVWGKLPTGLTCVAQDNGTGTAWQPAMCPYTSLSDSMRIVNGLPSGADIRCQTEMVMLSLTSEVPGGTLGGTTSLSDMSLKWHMTGTGSLSGYSRDVAIPLPGTQTDQGPRVPGTSPQTFGTDLRGLQGQLPPGDPDFDLLRITAGSSFGMPSPGHTTLTSDAGMWQVESFFDITYRIDFVGRPGGPLSGMSGSTTGTIRMSQGTAPTTSWVDLHEPQPTLPPINNTFNVAIDPNGQFGGGSGSDQYGQGWYIYPSQWINIWFYDHPYDPARYKKIHIEFDLLPWVAGLPSMVVVAVNWSTDQWSLQGNPPPAPRVPPLPGTDEALYIGRNVLLTTQTASGHYIFDYQIPDYNPEWVSIDVQGRNFIIPGGIITHECDPKLPGPSMDLAFVITGGNVTLGACCVPSPTGTTCQQLTAAACQTAGGAYLGDGVPCVPNPCSNPIGACCKPDGTCAIMSSLDCHMIGGAYQGDGTACAGVTCPPVPTGACCVPGMACQIMTKADCANAGGTYFGNGSTCTPDPCRDVTGACCLPSGVCVNSTELACVSHNGLWQGAGTDCATTTCPTPKVGACCLPTGGCIVETAALCAQQGGVYKGDGTVCTPNICAEQIGACCLPNGTCVQTTKDKCLSVNGVFFGVGTPCAPALCDGTHQLGACCLPDGTCIAPVPADLCRLKHGVFLGVGTTCAGVTCNPPATGACCLPNGNCVTVTKDSCVVRKGTYYGDGYPCSATLCPPPDVGACCLPDGTCIQTTSNKCKTQQGVWNGAGSSCATVNCPPREKGACCLPNGTCVIVLAAECKLAHGAFQGNGTSCSPNPCGGPKGACCLPTGGCIVTTVDNCQKLHGMYKGDGTPCLPNTCLPPTEVGACCLQTGGCIITTPAVCSTIGGNFKGVGTVCSATTCPGLAPTGACYLPDGTCIQTSQAVCYGANGAYQGDGTACTIALRGASCCLGTTGNVDGDPAEVVDISDVFAMVDYLGANIPPNPCFEEDDVDESGMIDISDLFAIIDFLSGALPLPYCP